MTVSRTVHSTTDFFKFDLRHKKSYVTPNFFCLLYY